MAKRIGLEQLRETPYWAAFNRGRDCTECGTCLPRCPYQLPIPDLMQENLRWLDAHST